MTTRALAGPNLADRSPGDPGSTDLADLGSADLSTADPSALATLPLPAGFELVHGPIAYWARHRPDACAIADGRTRISFAELHARIEALASRWQDAPATVLLDSQPNTMQCLIDFLAVIATGRCAALADPQWPASVRQAVSGYLPSAPYQPAATTPPSAPFYVGFTSGSTGLPKGFERNHQSWTESFRVSLADFGPLAAGRVLAPGRLSHSLFLFGALLGLWTGAGTDLQESFSAAQALRTLRAGHTPVLMAVPSQLMLLLALAARRRLAPLPQVRLILISGARWLREHTPALRRLFPEARIIEFYGASETSFIAWMDAASDAPPQAVGRPFSNVELHIGPTPEAPPLPLGVPGTIWVRSPMLFRGYLGPAQATAAQRVGPWLSVQDVGHGDASGLLHLKGRASRMLITRGKNLFPEEVEARLQAYPGVRQASLHGVPDPLRGQSVHAVLAWDDTVQPVPDALPLAQWCRATLEAYKAPRQWWRWHGDWPCTTSGKTDHGAIARALAEALVTPALAPAPATDARAAQPGAGEADTAPSPPVGLVRWP